MILNLNMIKKFYKYPISLALVLTMLFSHGSDVVLAADTPTLQESTSEKIFIPFRNEIPHYLSINSSKKSEVVKSLWNKLYSEEANWNSQVEGFSSWVEKYDDSYLGLDGSSKLLSHGTENHLISTSPGDFEAYFGNTIKNNPEFLGEILGINQSQSSEIMTNVVCNYLSNPEKYKIFPIKIANLTADGAYIGTSRTSSDNLLKNGSYKKITYDIYVLTALASLYEGDEKETYLSDKQVEWIKSYREFLYNQYVTLGDESLAKAYSPIYNLIARSPLAANNVGGKGQEFFDYVVDSKTGIGSWLNMNDNIDIKGLEEYNDLTSVFGLANGWCCGYESDSVCCDHQKCINFGKDVDRVAYLIFKNEYAMDYISNCPTVNNLIKDTDGKIGYTTLFNAKHSGDGQSGRFYKEYTCGNGYKKSKSTTRNYGTDGNGDVTAIHTGTAVFPIGELDLINSATYVYIKGLSSPKATGWYSNKLTNWSVTIDGEPIATPKNQTLVQANYTSDGLQFCITGLSDEDRAKAEINVSAESYKSYPLNYPNGSPWPSFTSTVTVDIKNIVYLEGYYPESATENHDYTASETNKTIVWSNGYTEVTFYPYCTREVSHKLEPITVKADITTEGDYIVYKAFCPEINKQAVKRISMTNGSSTEVITLNSTNSIGNLFPDDSSDERHWPAGSLSNATYKKATTDLSVRVLPGVIKAGTKSISVDMKYSKQLSDLVIQIRSATGEELGRNMPTVCSTPDGNGDYTYTNSFKVNIKTNVSDLDLMNCTVIISARSITQNWTPNKKPSANIPKAYTYIKLNSITAQY